MVLLQSEAAAFRMYEEISGRGSAARVSEQCVTIIISTVAYDSQACQCNIVGLKMFSLDNAYPFRLSIEVA
jgi:hypothetical protein